MKKPDPTIIFAFAMLFSGASLLAAIYLKLPLSLALGLLGLAALSCMGIIWANITPHRRQALKRQLLIGLIAGIIATLAYDVTRVLLVYLGQLQFFPFETFNVFGKLIVGEGLPRSVTLPIGTLYHLLNGVCFAIAYCIAVGGRNWKFGVLWAFILEGFMLMVYPGWLNLSAVMEEFIAVSLFGHVAYGATLGLIAQKYLRKSQPKIDEPERKT